MPDWTSNTVTCGRETVASIKERYCGENGDFDFNKVIPAPESIIGLSRSSSNDYDTYYYLSERLTRSLDEVMEMPEAAILVNRFSKDGLEGILRKLTKALPEWVSYERGKQLAENYQQYGVSNEYDWCCRNWGTKWDASDGWWTETAFGFCTAYDPPLPIFAALCQEFPDAEMYFESIYETEYGQVWKNDGGELKLVFCSEIDWDYETSEEDSAYDVWYGLLPENLQAVLLDDAEKGEANA